MNAGPKDIRDPKNQTEWLPTHPLQTCERDPKDYEFARENSPQGPRTLHLDHKSSYEQK
tara:strand:- start:144 stop:320 length:177 start_codon:yes stop_codon:yes gene_type:complete